MLDRINRFFDFINSCGTGGDCDLVFFFLIIGAGALSGIIFVFRKIFSALNK